MHNITPAHISSSPTLCSAELAKSQAGELRPLAGIVWATHLQPCWEASAFAYSKSSAQRSLSLPFQSSSPLLQPSWLWVAHSPTLLRPSCPQTQYHSTWDLPGRQKSCLLHIHHQESPPQSWSGSHQSLKQKASRKAFSLSNEHGWAPGTWILRDWQTYALWF